MLRRRPAPPLDAFVEALWWSRRLTPYETREHMLPTGACQLVIALHEEPIGWAPAGAPDAASSWQAWRRGVVHGPQSTFYQAGPKPPGAVLGASFRPGAAGAVLGAPPAALLDRHVAIDDLWGTWGRTLHARLAESRSPHDALSCLERALAARLDARAPMHPAVAQALDPSMAGSSIGQLHRATGYSHRHFVALFRAAVGLAPKRFFRIQRFTAAACELAVEPVQLAELALRCGYADQAHLAREFRAFCGVPPTAYRPPSRTSPFHHVVG